MAIAFRAVTGFTDGNGTSIASVAKPSGTQVGDVLIASVYLESSQAIGTPSIASTGDTWTLVHNTVVTATTPDFEHYVWICVVGNASSTIGVTWDGDAIWRDFMVIGHSGVDNTTPQDATATENTGSGTPATFLSITTATDAAWLVALLADFDGRTLSSWSSPLTERHDGGNVGGASGEQASAGASGDKTVTLSAGGSDWSAIMVALRPAEVAASGQPYIKRTEYVPHMAYGNTPLRRRG